MGLPESGFRKGFFQENKPEDNPKRFGTLVADFHKAIRTLLVDEQRGGFMDFRDSAGTGPEEVWNQAVYKYVAQMWETTPHGNWHDIQVETTLFANEDSMRPDFTSSGSPATVSGNPKDAVLNSDADAIFRNDLTRYRLIFKPDGDINATHANNEWQSVTSADGTGLYAPRFLFVPQKPTGNSTPDGNTTIAVGDIAGLLELRDTFK